MIPYYKLQIELEDSIREDLSIDGFPIDYFIMHSNEFNVDFIREFKDIIDWNEVFFRTVGNNKYGTKEEVIKHYHPYLMEFYREYGIHK